MTSRAARWWSSWVLAGLLVVPEVRLSADPRPVNAQAVQRAFLQEDFESASALARAFLHHEPVAPERPRVWLWLALSLDQLDRSMDALQELDGLKRELASSSELWPEMLFWEGEISRRVQQMGRAIGAYEQALARQPSAAWALQAQMGLGRVYLHRQDFVKAAELFQRVAQQQPATTLGAEAAVLEGLCYLKQALYERAATLFEAASKRLRDPQVAAQAACYLGESLTALGRYDEAAAAYGTALTVSPDSPWGEMALFGLGWARFQTGHCRESVGVLTQYLSRVQPGEGFWVEARFAQANCLLQEGRHEQALGGFEQLLSRTPAHPLAIQGGMHLYQAYVREARFALARLVLEVLLKQPLDPASRAHLRLQAGATALEAGDARQAHLLFQLAAQANDPLVQQAAVSGLGDVQLFLGDIASARRRYEEALALSGDGPAADAARYQLGRVHLQEGELDEAAAAFTRVLERSTSEELMLEAQLAAALTAVQRGDDVQARSALARVRRTHAGRPGAARAGYYFGLMALRDGDAATAQRLSWEMLAAAPRSPEAANAYLLLADLRAQDGAVKEAEALLQQAYRLTDLPFRQRARLAMRLGDFARATAAYIQAQRWYDRASRLLPSLLAEATYRTASCYEDGGDEELALRWYQAIRHGTWRVRGGLAAAKLLERQDRFEAAWAVYEALAKEPTPEAALIRERLASRRDKQVYSDNGADAW